MGNQKLYPRGQLKQLKVALSEAPVVFIQGPRQCGKTTIAMMIQENPNAVVGTEILNGPVPDKLSANEVDYQYYTMDDELTRTAASNDPSGFICNLPERVILDEIQRVPDLFLEIKAEVDRRREAGRFLLTGSSQAMSSPKVSESLAGRMALTRLHPLSQLEIKHGRVNMNSQLITAEGFFELLLDRKFETAQHPFDESSLPDRILKGGFPEALKLSTPRSRNRWYRDYIDLICQRDILDLSRIQMIDVIPDILLAAAEQNAGLLNVQRFAQSFGVSWPAMRDYFTLLKQVYLLEMLRPWHKVQMKRLVKTPKLHMGDSGLACSLLSLNSSALESDRILYGRVLENFVYLELIRQASWRDARILFYHFRDKDKKEVDIVMEVGGRHIAGVEVKASRTVRRSDFSGLRRLQAISGERFIAGAVLYCGDMCIAFEENMFALPISVLWDL